MVLTKEPHSAPAALMKKSSQSYFTGGGLLHAYVKRKPCCNGRRSRFKSFQVQIRCIKSMGGGGTENTAVSQRSVSDTKCYFGNVDLAGLSFKKLFAG